MKLLSVCIPNYNRPDRLKTLVDTLALHITLGRLEDWIEICISDDASETDMYPLIRQKQREYEKISIVYVRNDRNMGMDYNFLNAVKISEGKFCWLMGNDDLPEAGGLQFVVDTIRQDLDRSLDILVTPFDHFDGNHHYMLTVYPLKKNDIYKQVFNTREKSDLKALLGLVGHNSALFGFLSNIVFRRECWMRHGNMFSSKMGSIFIQMYMNIQTLMEGAGYFYIQRKVVRNFADEEVNGTFDRWGRIAAGLADVTAWFFQGEERDQLLDTFVSGYIRGEFWELPDGHAWKKTILNLNMKKVEIYNQYYITTAQRSGYYAQKNIIIFGAGEYGARTEILLKKYCANIIGFCDNDVAKQGKIKEGYPIYSVEEMLDFYQTGNVSIVVANRGAADAIIEQLASYGVQTEKISVII